MPVFISNGYPWLLIHVPDQGWGIKSALRTVHAADTIYEEENLKGKGRHLEKMRISYKTVGKCLYTAEVSVA